MFEEWKNWLDDNHEGMGLKIRDDAPPEVKEEFALWSEEHAKKRAMGSADSIQGKLIGDTR